MEKKNINIRGIQLVDGIQLQPNLLSATEGAAATFKWNTVLEKHDENDGEGAILDIRSFYSPPLGQFLKVIAPRLKVSFYLDCNHLFYFSRLKSVFMTLIPCLPILDQIGRRFGSPRFKRLQKRIKFSKINPQNILRSEDISYLYAIWE
jgi:hypothetical protein